MKKFCLISFFLFGTISVLSQPATKEDIKLLIEQMREDNRILREDMNKRFEQVDRRFEQVDKQIQVLREDINKQIETLREDTNYRFEILFWVIGGLFLLNCGFLGYLWKEQQRIEKHRYDIEYFAYELYRAKPQLKAEIYFHLQQEAEKIKEKTTV